MNRNKVCAAALTAAAAVTLALTGGGPATAAGSSGAEVIRYSECSDPAVQPVQCVTGRGTFNIVATGSGGHVIVSSDSNLYTVTSPEIGTYTARSKGSFTLVSKADGTTQVERFRSRQVFSQTGLEDCIATENYVFANGRVRHTSSEFDASCFE